MGKWIARILEFAALGFLLLNFYTDMDSLLVAAVVSMVAGVAVSFYTKGKGKS